MNDHVGKPFRRDVLLEAIERWATKGVDQVPKPAEEAVDRAVFEDVAATVGPEMLKRLLGTLAEELEARFGEAGAQPSREELAGSAHAMVSMSGMLGFSDLSRLCSEVEAACRQVQSTRRSCRGCMSCAIRRSRTSRCCEQPERRTAGRRGSIARMPAS